MGAFALSSWPERNKCQNKYVIRHQMKKLISNTVRAKTLGAQEGTRG